MIEIFPVLSYAIETETPDAGAILVSERDGRLNDVRAAIATWLLELEEEAVRDEALWDVIDAEFEAISKAYSDDKMTVTCKIQGLERDVG